MNTSAAPLSSSSAAEFSDGLGVRLKMADATVPEPLEILRLRSEFLASPSFEFMLRERVSRLANFRHAYYSRVRRVDRLDSGSMLGIVSESPQGPRLSRILEVAHACQIDLDVNAALCLVRQLVPAIAMLHQNARDVSHGALAPERIVVTSNARVVIVEYVLGAAIEQLAYSRERLWKELRIAVPSGAGVSRLNHRADVMQLGMVALALVLGRPLWDDDLKSLSALVASATESSVMGGRESISEPLRRWLSRSLQLDSRASFESALEAQLALDDVLSGEGGYIAAPIALESFLARYEECAATMPAPVPPPVAAAPAVSHVAPASRRPSGSHAPAGAPTVVPVVPVAPAAPEPFVPGAPEVEIAPIAADTSAPARPRSASGSRPAVVVTPAEEPPAQTETITPDTDGADELRQMFARDSVAPKPVAGIAPFWRLAAFGLAAIALAEGAFIAWTLGRALVPSSAGTVAVESKPSGAQVKIDGELKGGTPLSMSVSAGAHVLEITTGGEPRVIPITIAAGQTYAQYVELATGVSLGRLAITSTPAGATILVDGQPKGVAPTELADVAAGEHELMLELNGMRVRQPVTVAGGTTTTVTVPMTGPGAMPVPPLPPTTGSLTVTVPFEMQVFEGERLLGATGSRLILAPGPHDLQIVSETLAFKTALHAEIFAGKVTRLPVTLPKGVIHLNAAPWAEVWIDGEKVGETPLGNLPIAIGPHEIVFKHPEFGEQHHAATVTAAAPVRLSVDLTKPQ
jgi:hypothetical protein